AIVDLLSSRSLVRLPSPRRRRRNARSSPVEPLGAQTARRARPQRAGAPPSRSGLRERRRSDASQVGFGTVAVVPSASSLTAGRRMLNKVPEVTLYFWVIKVLCTTVGETASDYLSDNVGLGLTKTTLISSALLLATLVFQFCARRYVAGIYWTGIVLIS